MHPDYVEAMEEAEERRLAEGFAVEADRFIHTYTHQDHLSPFPTKFVATNEESYLQGGTLGQLVKKYKHLSDWELGWGVLETRQISGAYGNKEEVKIKNRSIVVPLEGLLDYLDDCELVAYRLKRAAEELVRRYNQQQPKKVLDWKDQVWSEEWDGKNEKQETTVYELTLSTFAFFGSHEQNPEAVISQSDIRVNIKLRTTHEYRRGGAGGTTQGTSKIDGFRRDQFGYNTRLDHFLNVLNAPGFQREIARARVSFEAYKQLVKQRKESEQVIQEAARAAIVAQSAAASNVVGSTVRCEGIDYAARGPPKKRIRLDPGYDYASPHRPTQIPDANSGSSDRVDDKTSSPPVGGGDGGDTTDA